MPRLELKSAATFLAIKCCERTKIEKFINSLTPKSVLAGTENSRVEGFWLAKHKHTNILTTIEPFHLQRHGFDGGQ